MMKLVVHKMHCPDCKELVNGRKEKNGAQLKLSCPKCQRPLWNYDGHSWHYAGSAKIGTV